MRARFHDVVGSLLDEHPQLVVVLADIGADHLEAAASRHAENACERRRAR